MKYFNEFEDELDEIRVGLYEQTKDMTLDERVTYLKSLAAPVLEEYGLHTLSDSKTGENMRKEAVFS